jgi:hypothetical protein
MPLRGAHDSAARLAEAEASSRPDEFPERRLVRLDAEARTEGDGKVVTDCGEPFDITRPKYRRDGQRYARDTRHEAARVAQIEPLCRRPAGAAAQWV